MYTKNPLKFLNNIITCNCKYKTSVNQQHLIKLGYLNKKSTIYDWENKSQLLIDIKLHEVKLCDKNFCHSTTPNVNKIIT